MPLSTPIDPRKALQNANDLQLQGKAVEAEAEYRKIIAEHPDFDPAYHGLGLLALQAGKLPLAVRLIDSAIALNPSGAAYHRDCGEILRRMGQSARSVERARSAVQLQPREASGHFNLGLALMADGKPDAALQSYRESLQIDPRHAPALNNMGAVLETLGQPVAAEQAYRRAIDIRPDHAESHNNLGALLLKLGALDEARESLERAIGADPKMLSAHFNLAPLKRYFAEDPHLAMLERMAQREGEMSGDQQVRLYFTLGKARDDAEDYRRAFAAYERGNELKRRTLGSNGLPNMRLQPAICAQVSTEFLAECASKWPASPNRQSNPVFIVGMPRSGTSLIEQILASHPGVFGAGELKDFHDHAQRIVGDAYPYQVNRLAPDAVAKLGEDYLRGLSVHAPDALRITDKLPGNFHYLGLIHLALPNAKVIHVRRDPMDSCISCYTKLFKDTMGFTYSLQTLAEYYVRYEKIMAHWRQVLPEDFILEVQYEDLVADTAAQTERMLAHIRLPWDDKCLAFYDNERPVMTASRAQVRQPIYDTSIGSWKRFESQLSGLLNSLAAYR